MKLSTKGRYAMVALADLALAKSDDLMSLAAISKRQDISLPYLEQLFVKLRRAGLVEAVRGPGGGYRLARSPSDIRGRGQRWRVGQPGAKHDQSALGGAFGPCLCVFAPDPAFRCDPQPDDPLSGGACAVSGGG